MTSSNDFLFPLITIEYLSHLFLTEEERLELRDLIVLDPDWLMRVMKVIMDFKTTKYEPDFETKLITTLEVDGMADLKLLKFCWKKFLSEAPCNIEIRHLCLILKAHCLIYPVEDSTTAAGSGDNSAEVPAQKYIIPCKLPCEINMDKHKWVRTKSCGSAKFYFNFKRFLPDEIYHRLICLASSEAKPPGHSHSNGYSSEKCIFYGILNTNWVIGIERVRHRLEIRVM